MAESGAAVLSFVLMKIDNALKKEWRLPESVKAGIKRLKDELGMMMQFLEGAGARAQSDFQVWTQQVRQLAHDIEDVLDEFDYKNAQENAPWYARSKWKSTGNHSIAALIQNIETNLKSIKEKMERYPSHDANDPAENFHHGIASYFTPDEEIVGMKQPREEMTSWMLDIGQSYKERFVVGMGGSGKTTLVKLVYERLKQDFDCHVWLTASNPVTGEELLHTMLAKFCNQTSDSSPSKHSPALQLRDLIDNLRNYLQDKRYLIVLDDLWSKGAWEKVKCALPKDTCKRGRVIITTRRGDIASSSRDDYVDVYNLQPLPTEMAKQLFDRKAFPPNGTCPPALRGWSDKLLRKCEGLPLGIIEIGKVVSRTPKREFDLKILHDSLKADLGSGGQLSSITERLLLSYYELPAHLKGCFQYTSMFTEDSVLKGTTLIRLWIAEGFIKEETGKKVEDIGLEYLKELVERNLIQVVTLDFNGKPRTCKVHNLLHKIVTWVSENQNFCSTYSDQGGVGEKIRRLSIQNHQFDMSNKFLPHARSLFTSTLHELRTPPRIHSSLKLLKILHLEGANVHTFPKGIKNLLLLKYLCLSKTRIKEIPLSIGRLRLLETLILKETLVTTLPNTVTNLEKLRHLVCYRKNAGGYEDAVQGLKVSLGISKLTNLQTLVFVKATKDHKIIQDLGNLTQLRKLGIVDLLWDSRKVLCKTIKMLKNLQYLNLTSLSSREVLDIEEVIEPPQHLQQLYLKGHLEKMPSWISKLHDLAKVQLQWSRLTHENNPILILEDLPRLVELQLLNAYTGNRLDFNAGKFQKLKILEFEQMEELRIISVDRRALPCLKKLIIRQCRSLADVPVGIDELSQLEELQLSGLAPDFVNPLRREGGKRHLVRRVRKIISTSFYNGEWVSEDL